MNQPIKRFKARGLIASIFVNRIGDDDQRTAMHNVVLQRIYKDKDGQFHYTTSLRGDDLPKAMLVLSQAYEYLMCMDVNHRPAQEPSQSSAGFGRN